MHWATKVAGYNEELGGDLPQWRVLFALVTEARPTVSGNPIGFQEGAEQRRVVVAKAVFERR